MTYFDTVGSYLKNELKQFPLLKVPQRLTQLPKAQQTLVGATIGAGTAASIPAGAFTAVGGAARTAASNAGKYTLSHPISALKIGGLSVVGGIIGYNAIKTNPQIITKGVPAINTALSDAGTTIGEISKAPSFGDAFGHLRSFVQEHPIAATGAAVAGLGMIGAASLLNTAVTKENTAALKNYSSVESSGGSGAVLPLSGDPNTNSYNLVPDTVPEQSKSVKKYSYRKRKTKSINRSPITIKNYNILGVKRYG